MRVSEVRTVVLLLSFCFLFLLSFSSLFCYLLFVEERPVTVALACYTRGFCIYIGEAGLNELNGGEERGVVSAVLRSVILRL